MSKRTRASHRWAACLSTAVLTGCTLFATAAPAAAQIEIGVEVSPVAVVPVVIAPGLPVPIVGPSIPLNMSRHPHPPCPRCRRQSCHRFQAIRVVARPQLLMVRRISKTRHNTRKPPCPVGRSIPLPRLHIHQRSLRRLLPQRVPRRRRRQAHHQVVVNPPPLQRLRRRRKKNPCGRALLVATLTHLCLRLTLA